jgi:putative membrane protein
MMGWYGNGMSGWGYAFMVISNVVIWVLIVGGVVAVIRYLTTNRANPPTPPTAAQAPDQVLAQRYARGEIDEDEYRRRLDTLHDTARQAGRG